MTDEQNKVNQEKAAKEMRSNNRRAEPNRRSSIRFGDALGRRDGNERRSKVTIKQE